LILKEPRKSHRIKGGLYPAAFLRFQAVNAVRSAAVISAIRFLKTNKSDVACMCPQWFDYFDWVVVQKKAELW